MPAAMAAAFSPETPAPITTTLAAYTPGTPPIRTPRPPSAFIKVAAPTCGASRPATSDIGASRGSAPSGVCTVSYAMPVTWRAMSSSVSRLSAARCR